MLKAIESGEVSSTQSFTIRPIDDDIIGVAIYSIDGRKVLSRNIDGSERMKVEFDNLRLPTGAYLVRATLESGRIINEKLILQR